MASEGRFLNPHRGNRTLKGIPYRGNRDALPYPYHHKGK